MRALKVSSYKSGIPGSNNKNKRKANCDSRGLVLLRGMTKPGSSAGRKERGKAGGQSGKNQQGDAEGEEPGMRWQRHWDWSVPQPTTENYTHGKHGWKRPAPYVCNGVRITLLPEIVKGPCRFSPS